MNNTLIDWNCDLLSSVRIDQPNAESQALETLRYMMEKYGFSRFCMMPLFDARKEPVSVFFLKRAAYEDCVNRALPKNIAIQFSAKVLLYRGLSDLSDLERLTETTGGYLPLLMPISSYEDWMDAELNRLLYKRKIKLLLLSCELFPILYPAEIVEKLLRMQDAIFQFHYQALTDPKLCRMIFNMYQRNQTILFGTGIDCLKRAWGFPFHNIQNSATASLFSRLDLQRLEHTSRRFWETGTV